MRQIQLFEDPYSNKLIFQFLNGAIELRTDQYGAYALCPGCGAGKTTIIKQLIALKWYEGVLYAAFTQNELNEMYQFCTTLIGTTCVDKYGNEHVLRADDIILLHSDFSKAGTDKDMWFNRPEDLLNKKIILCTHAKLTDEPLHLLIRSNFTPKLSDIYGPDIAATICSDANLPRQWILIDESTEAKSVMFKINKLHLFTLGKKVKHQNVLNRDHHGNIIGHQRLNYPDGRWVRSSNTFSDFELDMETIAESSKEFRTTYFRDGKNRLNGLRNLQLHQSLFNNFELYANLPNDQINIQYSYTNIINPMMNTHMLLLDGTSDITLSSSNKFLVLSYLNKYNSPVSLSRFPFSMTRKLKLGPNTDANLYLRTQISNLADDLSNIISANNKTLIFTWMDIKTNEVEINDDEPDDTNEFKSTTRTTYTPVNEFYKCLEIELESRGFKSGVNFSIEYYGGGKDKATNIYRDYDAVILCGRYQVPQKVITDNKFMYGTNITGVEYYANRVVQAICRTRIRRHDSQPINVYMSSDWHPEIINYVSRYFNTSVNNIVLNKCDVHDINRMYENLMTKGVTPKKAEQIAKLSTLDSLIYDAIMNDTIYSCQLKLDDVFNVLPMSRKEVDKYRRLIDAIKKYGIELSMN